MKNFLFLVSLLTFISFITEILAQKQRAESDGKLSSTENVRMKEKSKFKATEQKLQEGTQFNQFVFTIKGEQEFLLNLPVSQQVALHMYTYVMKNNAYMRLQNIKDEPPIKVFVFQNNEKIIVNSQFYFQDYIIFDGQLDKKYSIRFSNPGKQKLITMNLKKVTETAHIDQVAENDVANKHSKRSKRLKQQLKYIMNGFQKYSMMNLQAVKSVLSNIGLYYYWEILQIIVAAAVCTIQMSLIRNICKDKSIV